MDAADEREASRIAHLAALHEATRRMKNLEAALTKAAVAWASLKTPAARARREAELLDAAHAYMAAKRAHREMVWP